MLVTQSSIPAITKHKMHCPKRQHVGVDRSYHMAGGPCQAGDRFFFFVDYQGIELCRLSKHGSMSKMLLFR